MAAMGFADDRREKPGHLYRFLARQLFDFDLAVLGHKLADEHGTSVQLCRKHPVAQIRRQMVCSFHNAFRLIGRHSRARGVRRSCFHRLFQVQQAITFLMAIYVQQNGVTRTAERAASFHPIGGVNEFYVFVIVARTQTGGEAVHFFIRQEFFDAALLLLGKGPETLADRKGRVRALEVLRGERLPRRRGGLFRDAPYGLRLVEVAVLVEIRREPPWYSCMIRSSILTVVSPGRSDPLAADASDRLSRMRSCAGFPMTV